MLNHLAACHLLLPRPRKSVYRDGQMLLQDLGAFVQSTARRIHIIDDDHSIAITDTPCIQQLLPVLLIPDESTLQIRKPFAPCLHALPARMANALQGRRI